MSAGKRRIAVIGAGWGGLAAAVELTRLGHAVTVLEAGREAGGRARRVVLDGRDLDNGQHLLIGAYEATLSIIRAVGIDPADVLEQRPLDVRMVSPADRFELRLPRRGGAAALALGLASARGISAGDRARALWHARALRRVPEPDCSAAEWLARSGQPQRLVRCLWEPLCLAALNAPAAAASAQLFARVLGETFRGARHSDLLLPRTDLGGLFPRPACRWLFDRGQAIHTGTRAQALHAESDGWHVDPLPAAFDDVVVATDPANAARLLPDDRAGRAHAARLRGLGAAPIATVYLDYASDSAPAAPMLGRLDGPGQWVFDRAASGAPGIFAVVISGRGEHETLGRAELGSAVAGQLAADRPTGRAPRVLGVIREKRATFDPRPGIEGHRLGVRGPAPGLWYAGDHVATGLPATLEGAVRAGRMCASAIDEQGAVSE